MMHGVVAAATCTVPKVMRVSGEKSLINMHTCALGDEVVYKSYIIFNIKHIQLNDINVVVNYNNYVIYLSIFVIKQIKKGVLCKKII